MRNKVVALATAVTIGMAAMTTGALAAGHGGGGVAAALAARMPVLAAGILVAGLPVRTLAASPRQVLR